MINLQGSVAMPLRCCGIFDDHCKFATEIILKIGWRLTVIGKS